MNMLPSRDMGVMGVLEGQGSSSTSLDSSAGSSSNLSSQTSTSSSLVKTSTTSSFANLLAKARDSLISAAKDVSKSSVVKSVLSLFTGDVSANPTIKIGSKGQAVTDLQSSLNKLLNVQLTVDGDFGQKTNAAVRAYQTARGLTVDGIVGPKTWAAIESDLSSQASATTAVAKAESAPQPTTQSSKIPTTSSISSSAHADAVIKQGDKNAQVLQFQAGINNMGYNSLTGKPALDLDGVFGPKTQEAVTWAESALGLTTDGIVDAELFSKVSSTPAKETSQPLTSSGSDLLKTIASAVSSIKESDAIVLANVDSKVMTNSRYQTAASARTVSSLLVDAVIAQVTSSTKGQLFTKFFTLLNPLVPAIIKALAWHESSVNNAAVGSSGEVSVFQLLPATVKALQSKYSLPALAIDNAASLSAYLIAMLVDLDSFAGNYLKKSVSGSVSEGQPGNDHMTAVLSRIPDSPAVISQLFSLFFLYNAGVSEKFWSEDWRAAEALKRTISTIVDAGGY